MAEKKPFSLGKRVLNAATMAFVLWVSLVLLIYVAIGESRRTYETFQADKMTGQVSVVQNAMEAFLRSGLPLRQFVGFTPLAEQILESDGTIQSVVAYDQSGRPVFRQGEAISPLLDGTVEGGMRSDSSIYQVQVKLSNKFEQVGSLAITMPRSVVTDRVSRSFDPLMQASAVPAFAMFVMLFLFGPALRNTRVPWAQIGFVLAFLAMSGWVIGTLVTLYSDGAQSKASALADSLGQRLSDLVAFNINIDEIDGLDRTFGKYIASNPDIESASLVIDGKTVMHTDQSQIGQSWKQAQDTYQYTADLSPEGAFRKVFVAVELPSQVVMGEIMRSIKNFAALFIASAFLATLFFQVGGTMNRGDVVRTRAGPLSEAESAWMLSFARPVFFLGVLLEHLTYVFLPQMVKDAALSSGVSEGLVSAPFVGFYAFFALALIPAGHLAQRWGAKPLMYGGLLLSGLGLGVLALPGAQWTSLTATIAETTGLQLGGQGLSEFWMIMVARCVSGIGQGMLFIGVQSYLLAAAQPGKKTQAAAIIVYGFQGGMISGMAVGSLLVGSIGTQGVFQLSCVIAFVAALYTLLVVPKIDPTRQGIPATQSPNMLRNTFKALRNADFINTMLTIGMPAKAILTGIITFALPLLLAQSGYAKEDIGQIIMIYALSVVASSRFIAPRVDRLGSARTVLFQGAILSAAGLGVIAVAGLGTAPEAQAMAFGVTVWLAIGVAMVGIAHGFINAPVVTYVADSQLASRVGAATATATYRFLERIGHVAGPVMVGQLLVWVDDPWGAVGFSAIAVAVLGLFFFATSRAGPGSREKAETPEVATTPAPQVAPSVSSAGSASA